MELRGSAPIGMLEYWNDGIMGFLRMVYRYVHLKMKGLNEKIPLISTSPNTGFSTFQSSIILLFHVRGKISDPDKHQ